jgi:hypothetical protein
MTGYWNRSSQSPGEDAHFARPRGYSKFSAGRKQLRCASIAPAESFPHRPQPSPMGRPECL